MIPFLTEQPQGEAHKLVKFNVSTAVNINLHRRYIFAFNTTKLSPQDSYLVDHVIDLAVGGVLPHASEDGCELLSGEDIIFKHSNLLIICHLANLRHLLVNCAGVVFVKLSKRFLG